MLRAAVYAGADSVYLGLTGFNARRGAGNFTPDELEQATAFCRARGVKVNVTLNTLCFDGELDGLREAVRAIARSGADAVIAQDLAAAALVRRCAPEIALHGSTQMSVMNLAGAKKLAEMGFSRVILARELTAEEVRYITENCGIETEIFVHGALCMSVSGQCYMSAFFGGRSGNRGGCAGPCRLPYRFCGEQGHFLSLKDLSLIDRLPEIREMGVCCAKIEGRLRTPEYVAAAVSAARAALDGLPYDRVLLEQAFSRAGFTDGFYENHYLSPSMFGRRDEQQAADTRAALPKLRELYRREREAVPVSLSLALDDAGAQLTVCDRDGRRVEAHSAEHPSPARQEEPALREGYARALGKTGGTPFFAEQVEIQGASGRWLPASCINELRRDALGRLLELRQAPHPARWVDWRPAPPAPRSAPARQALWLRFADAAQCTDEMLPQADRLVFPLRQFEQLPAAWREKSILALPRALFDEEEIARQICTAFAAGFRRFEIESIGGLSLVADNAPGAEICGGFGLNLTNSVAAAEYAALGLSALTLSPELPLADARRLDAGVPTGLLAYGHLPLMLTRACPVRAAGGDCARCGGKGALVDRKGKTLRVSCTGAGRDGARELLNPVPLWLGDRQAEIGTDFAELYFTFEDAHQAAEILRRYRDGAPFEGEFTRGLYYRAVE